MFKNKDGSRIFKPNGNKLKTKKTKEIFQIINTLNNEKIFFANKVILVEGVSDKIIFDQILKIVQPNEKNEIVEIVEVYGKTNFKKFSDFLATWEIDNFVIADLDYLLEMGPAIAKKLFEADPANAGKSMLAKAKKDTGALFTSLDQIVDVGHPVSQGNFTKLHDLWSYIKGRHLRLKSSLTAAEQTSLTRYIKKHRASRTYILNKGDIEDYFGGGRFDIDDAIVKAKTLMRIEDIDSELKDIVDEILKSE